LKRILAVLRRIGGRRFDLYVLLVAGNALLPVVGALIAREVIDELVSGASRSTALVLIGLEAAIIVGYVSLDQVVSYLAQELRFLIVQGISIRNATQAAALDITFYEDPEQCNLLYRIRQESYHRPMMLLNGLGAVLTAFTTTAGFFIAIAVWEPLLAVLFLVGMFPLLRWGQKAAGWSWMSHDLSTANGRWAAYFDDLLCEREAAKEVRLYDLAPLVLPRLRDHDDEHRRVQMAGVRAKTLMLIPGRAIGVLAQYAAVAWAAYQLTEQALSLGQFTLVIAALATCRQMLQGIVGEYVEIRENRHYFDELLRFWELKPGITSPPDPSMVAPLRDSIRFEHVSFRYPGSDLCALQDVDLEIVQGQSLAIVGLNGAGKTTLIKLLARLYEPTEGRILWDGVDVDRFDLVEYREQLSIVFQDFVRYQLSLKENITVGSSLVYDSDWFGRVLRVLGLRRLVDRLREGSDTLLGRQFHMHGAELSGGQWQRVAVARAIYKTATASLLVLDEPTSAMDAEQEALLYRTINEWKRDRTLILISHRLSSVRDCDNIVVLDDGRVIESGKHEVLMRAGGPYHRLFTTQARGYGTESTNPDDQSTGRNVTEQQQPVGRV
jgi:ATP-binding cassette subfamily B protein